MTDLAPIEAEEKALIVIAQVLRRLGPEAVLSICLEDKGRIVRLRLTDNPRCGKVTSFHVSGDEAQLAKFDVLIASVNALETQHAESTF